MGETLLGVDPLLFDGFGDNFLFDDPFGERRHDDELGVGSFLRLKAHHARESRSTDRTERSGIGLLPAGRCVGASFRTAARHFYAFGQVSGEHIHCNADMGEWATRGHRRAFGNRRDLSAGCFWHAHFRVSRFQHF